MFLAAGDYVVEQGLLDRFGIPEWAQPLVVEAWRTAPPALNYGRFDLGYDGEGPPKLFEFNCDTPTSLIEAAVVQWFWKEEVFPHADQFNSLHEHLAAKWADIAPYLADRLVHFGCVPDRAGEDSVTTAYMMDLARAAGLEPVRIAMRDIGCGQRDGGARFFDLEAREIRTLYKLYPWEWLVTEPFGPRIAENAARTTWIEPIWKTIWSNKAILPILWDLFPRHPNLLWARSDGPVSASYVKKPILAREGGNVAVVKDGVTLAATDGPYVGAAIWQDLFDLPDYAGNRPVIGSWIVDGEPAGMGIREDGLVTSNLARFVPHVID
jgi:glutathionylspermidine synthase